MFKNQTVVSQNLQYQVIMFSLLDNGYFEQFQLFRETVPSKHVSVCMMLP